MQTIRKEEIKELLEGPKKEDFAAYRAEVKDHLERSIKELEKVNRDGLAKQLDRISLSQAAELGDWLRDILREEYKEKREEIPLGEKRNFLREKIKRTKELRRKIEKIVEEEYQKLEKKYLRR